jgi:hypothetical protein
MEPKKKRFLISSEDFLQQNEFIGSNFVLLGGKLAHPYRVLTLFLIFLFSSVAIIIFIDTYSKAGFSQIIVMKEGEYYER